MFDIHKISKNKTASNIIIAVLFLILGFIVALIINELNNQPVPAFDTSVIVPGKEIADEITVDVKGAVAYPGIVKLKPGSRVSDAIEIAGGITEIADTSSVNIARVLSNGEMVYVYRLPTQQETEAASAQSSQTAASKPSAAKTPKPTAVPKPAATPKPIPKDININTATSEELELLPQIGPVIAQRIIDYRDANGDFTSIEEIKNVSGIGDVIFAKIKDMITVGFPERDLPPEEESEGSAEAPE